MSSRWTRGLVVALAVGSWVTGCGKSEPKGEEGQAATPDKADPTKVDRTDKPTDEPASPSAKQSQHPVCAKSIARRESAPGYWETLAGKPEKDSDEYRAKKHYEAHLSRWVLCKHLPAEAWSCFDELEDPSGPETMIKCARPGKLDAYNADARKLYGMGGPSEGASTDLCATTAPVIRTLALANIAADVRAKIDGALPPEEWVEVCKGKGGYTKQEADCIGRATDTLDALECHLLAE